MRTVAFVSWIAIGTVLSYGLLYALTPYGAAIIAICFVAGVGVSRIGRRWPEGVGLAAGPGVFCLVVAANAQDPAPWTLAGACLVATSCAVYVLTMGGRCARES
jgi:hypothetical protein